MICEQELNFGERAARLSLGNWHAYSGPSTYDFNETKGAIIATTYAGVYAIDWDNGKILWHYTDLSVPSRAHMATHPSSPLYRSQTGRSTHTTVNTRQVSPRQRMESPLYKRHNGKLVWKILNPMEPGAIADG